MATRSAIIYNLEHEFQRLIDTYNLPTIGNNPQISTNLPEHTGIRLEWNAGQLNKNIVLTLNDPTALEYTAEYTAWCGVSPEKTANTDALPDNIGTGDLPNPDEDEDIRLWRNYRFGSTFNALHAIRDPIFDTVNDITFDDLTDATTVARH